MGVKLTLPAQTMVDPRRRAEAFGHHTATRKKGAAARHGNGFDFPTTLIGTTPDGNVSVYCDPALGTAGTALARQVLAGASNMYADCQQFFATPGKRVNVVLAALGGRTDAYQA